MTESIAPLLWTSPEFPIETSYNPASGAYRNCLFNKSYSQQIRRELEYKIDQDFYWTDSKVVLGYICNESRRLQVFVSNRVQEIHETTTSDLVEVHRN